MYVNLIFLAVFIGYSVGTAPVIGYHYGAGHNDELKSLLKKSVVIIGVFSVLMTLAGEILSYPIALLFVGYDSGLMNLTLDAFKIFSFSFLFSGFSIMGSSFFTALGNGLTSALISFLRTLVFQVIAVVLLPVILGYQGIWLSVVIAEMMTVAVTTAFILNNRNTYHYL